MARIVAKGQGALVGVERLNSSNFYTFMLITISPDQLNLDPGSEVILHHQTWEDFEALLAIKQEKTFPKLYFNAKTGEIHLMSPLPSHGQRVNILGDLVKALLRIQGKDWQAYDPITLKQFKRAGVEPDTCFYIDNRQAILGKDRFDLTVDPPPDLAIEVDMSSLTVLEAYEAIAVPEIWIYRSGRLRIYLLRDGIYQEMGKSLIFPEWDITNLLPPFVEMAWQQGSSVALRQFEQLVQPPGDRQG
jgi:Uma2 family endonuclease